MSTSTGATINLGLTLPANVTAGGTVQAADVSTLYTNLNNFAVPASVAAFWQQVYATDTGQVLTGATSTAAVTLDTNIAVPANRTLIHLGTYSWATTGCEIHIGFRANAAGFVGGSTGASIGSVSTTTSGSGMYYLLLGPHDATVQQPVVGWLTGSTGNVKTFGSTAGLPSGAFTSIGLSVLFGTSTIGSTSSTLTLGHQRILREV